MKALIIKIFSIKEVVGPRREYLDHIIIDCFIVVIVELPQTSYRVSGSSQSNENARETSSHPMPCAGSGGRRRD